MKLHWQNHKRQPRKPSRIPYHAGFPRKRSVKALSETKPDILVLDVMMPQMDGFTLTKMIRQIDTRTPILFLTARSSVDDLVTGFHLGGNDYLKNRSIWKS